MSMPCNWHLAANASWVIRQVTPAGVVTTPGGLAKVAGSNDGTGSAARFYSPCGVAVDSAGNLYIADWGNCTIRKGIPNYGQPIVVEPPQSAATYAGSNVTMTANIIGNGPMSY